MLNNLSIAQEFVLLALDRDTNKLKSMLRMHVALYTAMACFVELSMNGNVTFADDDTVTIADSASTGEQYFDKLLEIIAAEKPRKLKEWVSYFYYGHKEIYKLVVESLAEKNSDAANARNRIVEKIRAELLENGNVEQRTLALALFLNSKGMLKDYFSGYEKKTLKQRMENFKNEDFYKKIKTMETVIQNLDIGL